MFWKVAKVLLYAALAVGAAITSREAVHGAMPWAIPAVLITACVIIPLYVVGEVLSFEQSALYYVCLRVVFSVMAVTMFFVAPALNHLRHVAPWPICGFACLICVLAGSLLCPKDRHLHALHTVDARAAFPATIQTQTTVSA